MQPALDASEPIEEPPAQTAVSIAREAPPAQEDAPLFRLYFLRHAPAGDRASWEGPDEARPLTGRGRKRLKASTKALRDLVGVPDAILSSPYARARETAELAAKSLRFTGEVEMNDHLVHGGRAEMLGEILAGKAGQKDIVLVGHSPDLERWIAHVTTGRDDLAFLELKKGGVCRVDVRELTPEPRGVIRWALPPSVLRGLGE